MEREPSDLLLPRLLPLAFDQQPTNVSSCRPRHHNVEAALP